MSFLFEKSKENLVAGELLMQNGHYSACIHCYYYCCVQLMLHYFYSKLGYNESTLKAKIDDYKRIANNKNQSGLHNIYFGLLRIELNSKDSSFAVNNLINNLKALKVSRNKSDYQQCEIFEETSIKSKQKAESIVNQFNSYLS